MNRRPKANDPAAALPRADHLARCSVFIATSVDGFIARPDGRLDFLPTGGGEEHGYSAFIKSVDAIVMGRGTYETVLSFEQWPFEQPVFVLTTRPVPGSLPAGARVQFMSGDPTDIVTELSHRGFRHIYVDGGVTIQRFLRAGLIQEMTITRVPVIIGEGLPLFGFMPSDIRLRHRESRSYPSGLVTTEYLVESVDQ